MIDGRLLAHCGRLLPVWGRLLAWPGRLFTCLPRLFEEQLWHLPMDDMDGMDTMDRSPPERVILTYFRATAKKSLETAQPLNSLIARGLIPFVNTLTTVMEALSCG